MKKIWSRGQTVTEMEAKLGYFDSLNLKLQNTPLLESVASAIALRMKFVTEIWV